MHTCDHKDDVVVECLPRTDATIHRNATIRLKDGNSSYSGRVEVLFDGKWGTVCDYGWDQRDAQVVCRQLGYQAGAQAAVNRAQFGEGKDQPIWMGNVRCSGKEKSIRDCAFDSKAHESCSHRQDVGVICLTTGSIRLIKDGVKSVYSGRVEMWMSKNSNNMGCTPYGIPSNVNLPIRSS